MCTYERLNELVRERHTPGAVVDEDYSEAEGPYLYYAFYDEDGNLIYYSDFPRDASPEQISEVLNDYADELSDCDHKNLSVEEIVEKIVDLRNQVKHVPGLHTK